MKKSWLEICHQDGCHYDSVLPITQENDITPPLKLKKSRYYLQLLLLHEVLRVIMPRFIFKINEINDC